jgi:hypothetical protein
MRSFYVRIFCGLLLIGGLLFLVPGTRAPVSPDVRVAYIGHMKATGFAAITISNASPFTVLRSPRYWVELPKDDGTTNRQASLLFGGMLLRSSASEEVTLKPPASQAVWRVEFEVAKWDVWRGLGLPVKKYYSSGSGWVHSDNTRLLTNRWTE